MKRTVVKILSVVMAICISFSLLACTKASAEEYEEEVIFVYDDFDSIIGENKTLQKDDIISKKHINTGNFFKASAMTLSCVTGENKISSLDALVCIADAGEAIAEGKNVGDTIGKVISDLGIEITCNGVYCLTSEALVTILTACGVSATVTGAGSVIVSIVVAGTTIYILCELADKYNTSEVISNALKIVFKKVAAEYNYIENATVNFYNKGKTVTLNIISDVNGVIESSGTFFKSASNTVASFTGSFVDKVSMALPVQNAKSN